MRRLPDRHSTKLSVPGSTVVLDGPARTPRRTHGSARGRSRSAAGHPAARPVRRGTRGRTRARGGTLAQSAAVACAGPRQRRRRRLRGVAFRSPASLIAEITGTRDDDPWSPMRWCGRCSPSSTRTSTRPGAEPWPPTSATSPRGGGGVAPGSPIRGGPPAGRAVRLLRPAASATAGRLARRRSRRTRRRPAMAAAAVAGAGRQDGHRPSARAAHQNRCPTAGVRCRAARKAVAVRSYPTRRYRHRARRGTRRPPRRAPVAAPSQRGAVDGAGR